MTQKPYLNLGCGKIQLPCERPLHHGLVNPAIYTYPLWHNVDKVDLPGVDEVVNIFTYPWPWEDNSFDGALLSHLVEHIPHEITIKNYLDHEHWHEGLPWYDQPLPKLTQYAEYLPTLQDGWYAFFTELYRVLTPGALAHILSPYGWSQGAITDPTHTRLITEHTFTHSMTPNSDGPFQYANGGIHFTLTQPPVCNYTELFQHLAHDQVLLQRAMQTQLNVVYEVYVQLEAVKDGG